MNDALIGLWRVVSAKLENMDTGELEDIFGPDPAGYLLLAPGGRMMTLLTSSLNRGNDPAALFNSMMAYSGMYHVDGDRLITDVDLAWFPAWVGAQQERTFRFEDVELHVSGGPILLPSDLRRHVRPVVRYRREDALAR
jgi:hypothetical protein